MLVQNPHLPWWKEFLFFESHLNLGGKDLYGSSLVGIPGIAIGFNENLGWTHTNNTIDNSDVYELALKDGAYFLDGEPKEFKTASKTIKIKQEDGTSLDHDLALMKTVHGPVVAKTEEKVLALRMVGLDRPDIVLQWWRMVNSTSFEEFEKALKMTEIPFWNVMYADREGNIFYLFNGLVPKRSSGGWAYWNRIIPGERAADIWTEVHPYADLPKVKNPPENWLQNCNDPPWTSTIPMALDPNDYPPYMAPHYMSFRPQRAARMMMEDESISFDELVEYKLSTHLEFADRILDDLFEAVDESGSVRAKEAKIVLENWDRKADVDSKGMVLFFNWARKFNVWLPSNFETGWDPRNPESTPDGLSDPARAVYLLEVAAEEVKAQFGRLDVPWGDFYRINLHGKDLPANGTEGFLGVFRVASSGGSDGDHMYVGSGDSWVAVIEFGEEVRAKVLLSYGNATQNDSPHKGDQLELFSRKEMREAWFKKAEVEANTARVEILTENGFKKK
jgi:acyl-homoserine-lactone acylase